MEVLHVLSSMSVEAKHDKAIYISVKFIDINHYNEHLLNDLNEYEAYGSGIMKNIRNTIKYHNVMKLDCLVTVKT